MDIFKLVGSIMVDSSEAEKSISSTDKKAEGLGNKLKNGAKTAAKWGVGLAAAAGGVATAMIASAKSTAANLDEIDKASQRMGVDAEQYQKLAYAADLSGVSTSQLEAASKKLKQNMGDDADLQQYLVDLANMTDETERNEKAAELFGAAVAQDLIPMLNAGGDGINAMMQEAEDLGQVMSNDAVKSGAEMNDTFTKIQGAIDTVKNEIGTQFMPVVQKILEWVIEHMPEIQAFVGDAIEFVKNLIQELMPVFEALMPVVEKVFGFIGKLWESYLKPIFMAILKFLDAVFKGDFKGIFESLADIVKTVFGAIVEAVKLPINAIIKLLNKAIDGFNEIKIPDWVPLVGGKGLNIPQIPLLANGGDIASAGTVMVGEKGPELLSLPQGARVTPLDKAGVGIDYDKLSRSIVNAMKEVLPDLQNTYEIVPDAGGIFNLVRQQSIINANLGRPGIVV